MMTAKAGSSLVKEESSVSPTKTLRAGTKHEADILGFLGIMNIIGCNYLAVITEAEVVGELYRAKVYKIT
jgi:hypothetical protein